MTFSMPSEVWLPPELDKKAKNLHARMAVYFDANIYKPAEERNDTLLFQYLYHIIYMLACTKKYFNSFVEYDQFAMFMATRLYMRYINPKHTEKCGKIKSVLNYCKALIGHNKVDFQRETFMEIFGARLDGQDDGSGELYRADMEDALQSAHVNSHGIDEEVLDAILELPKDVRKSVAETPYREGDPIRHRLEVSTLISVLNSVTLSNRSEAKLRAAAGTSGETALKESLYEAERADCVVLWRLGEEYHNMVALLVAKARRMASDSIGRIRGSMELNSEDLNAVILSAYGNVLRDNNEDF